MLKYNLFIVPAVFAVLSAAAGYWIFEMDWYFFPVPAFAGLFFVFLRKGDKSSKYLKSLIIDCVLYSVLIWVLLLIRLKILSGWRFDLSFSLETLYFIPIFTFISFLGGLAGIVFKGFYSLYTKIIDKIIIFISPLILTAFSLFFSYLDIGGTILSRYHGWPKPFLGYQIKDVIDGFLIGNWTFNSIFARRAVLNYLFFLAGMIVVAYLVKLLNKFIKKLKVNPAPVIFVITLAVAIIFAISPGIKKAYVEQAISNANYCETSLDCQFVAPKCPFGCAIYVNRGEYTRIRHLVEEFDSNCMYSCISCPTAVCENKKCRPVCGVDTAGEEWLRIVQAIYECNVTKVFQAHSLDVSATLKNGVVFRAKEPKIDDIIDIAVDAEPVCGKIRMATE